MKDRFVFAIAAAVASAGCTGGPGALTIPSSATVAARGFAPEPAMPPAGRRIIRPFVNSAAIARTANTIAVADTEDSVVSVFDPSGNLLAILSDLSLPEGLASDVNGDLFVVDTSNSRVQIYAAGFKSPPTTLGDPGEYPMGVDCYSNGRFVAVVNQYTTNYGPGSVLIYKDGKAGVPITDPAISQAYFDAFDADGNLYVDGVTKTGGFVGEIADATKGGRKLTMLTTANSISPGGIQVTTSGQIAILDQRSGAVDTYDPPSHGSLGSPVARTPLGGHYASIPFAFTKDMKHLYTTNYNDDNVVLDYAYPAGGAAVSWFESEGSYPFGVAVIPTQHPGGG